MNIVGYWTRVERFKGFGDQHGQQSKEGVVGMRVINKTVGMDIVAPTMARFSAARMPVPKGVDLS